LRWVLGACSVCPWTHHW